MNDKLNIPGEEGKQIDDLFRDALGNHTIASSDKLWNGISRKLLWNEVSRFNFINVSKVTWIAGTAVIAVIIGLLFLYPGNKQTNLTSSIKNQEPLTDIGSGKISIKNSIKEIKPASSVEQKNVNKVSTIPGTASSVLHKPIISSHVQGIASVNSRATVNTVNSTTAVNNTYEPGGDLSNITFPADRWSIDLIEPLGIPDLYFTNFRDTIISFKTPQGIVRMQKGKPGNLQSFSADFGVTPEFIKYKTTHSYSEINYWLNANIAYHFSKFSVQTGIGLGYVFDEGTYNTKYISKDSIGYFTSVISFYVDPANQNELIFDTKNTAVYDSLHHYADDRTRNRYTYLEFPLLFGYQIFETNNISLDITAGPAFTLLIGTREAQPVIDYPNARIVRIDDNTTQRVKTSWKVALGLLLEYRVTKNLGCYLEPSYKYYFNSFIKSEQTSSRDPYSIGIALGIRYHFGKIKK